MTMIDATFFAPAMRAAALGIARRQFRSDAGWLLSAGFGFDLIEFDRGRYRLTVDVAGYDENDLTVERSPDALVVSGDVTGDRSSGARRAHIHRSFRRVFPLLESVRVTGTELRNGLLSLELEADAQSADHPVRIPISGARSAGALDRLKSGVTSLVRRLVAKLS